MISHKDYFGVVTLFVLSQYSTSQYLRCGIPTARMLHT